MPMNTYDTVGLLFRHNQWANVRLFEACAGLTDEQLDQKIVGTYGSIRNTLEHIARSEAGYLHRITTGQPLPRDVNAPVQTARDLLESVRSSGAGFVAAAPAVAAGASVTIDWQGRPRAVPLVVLLTQAINHATEHRSQIMATLTQLGITPPDLDGWTYFAEHDE